MRHKLPYLVASLVCALALTACGSDGGGGGGGSSSGGSSGGDSGIQPTQTDIQAQIFDRSCALSSCHDATRSGGMDLRAPNMRAFTINVTAQSSPLPRINPGDPDNSFMIIKLEGPTEPSQGSRMPLGRPRLSDAKIQALRTWIAAGAPEN